MQVSSVCAYRFLLMNMKETGSPEVSENAANETFSSVFTSSLKNSDSVFDNISEWKTFCQNQIPVENLDYFA